MFFFLCDYLPTYLGIPFESGRENVYTYLTNWAGGYL